MKDGERILSEGREGGDQEFSVGHITFKVFCQGRTETPKAGGSVCG